MSTRHRLDQFLADRGFVASRARARDLIRRGLVLVDGAVARKPSQSVSGVELITVSDQVSGDVSRGAEKLRAALDVFDYDPTGVVAIDVGASTGGFTQVLLDRGARQVFAVDVGSRQLHQRLVGDDRVIDLSATDARRLTRHQVTADVTAIVCDVSFISLTKVLPTALALAMPGAWCVALIKPQFEAGPEAIGKGGIVRDEEVHAGILVSVEAWFTDVAGWRVDGMEPSPITGGDGNVEWLIGARKVREEAR